MKLAPLLALLLLAVPAPKPADGRAVMDEVDKRRKTKSEYSEGLIVVEEKGKTKSKSWRSWHLGWGADAKGLIQFLEPAEVKGVGLLTVSHTGLPAEQWFYAPAIDRDRRVAKQEKTTRFLGTHFTYEDMEERDVDAYTYTLDGEEAQDGASCFKVTAVPAPGKESQYSKLVFWVLEDRYVTIRIEAYVGGEKRRTFIGADVRDVSGIPIVHSWTLTDAKREGTTKLTLANVKINPAVDPPIFTVQGMRVIH
ncbi:MAG TPA: outer membrane lipoprotein-sorting protein [Candidatus Polarisedimenticolaceae bacterium]|nr:outer membrane lipoprotein-sorting protein [Candidatus Polarisedimenticolaceae bacterium]